MIFIDEFPDCEACEDTSKRVTARTIDLDGPGKVGHLYSCDNKACAKKKWAVLGYHLRKEMTAREKEKDRGGNPRV